MSETKLTKSQRAILAACPDWSADWEIRDRLGRYRMNGILVVLRKLCKLGLVEFGRANFTFRQTDAGRAAIAKATGEAS